MQDDPFTISDGPKRDPTHHESLIHKSPDPLIDFLNKIVVFSVKCLAILMVGIIFWALLAILFHFYENLDSPLEELFNAESLIATLGDFLVVLIAIEIFMNIAFYLSKDAIHVPLVLSTALTAVARKVIIMDYSEVDPLKIFSVASIILAVGLTFWLVSKKSN